MKRRTPTCQYAGCKREASYYGSPKFADLGLKLNICAMHAARYPLRSYDPPQEGGPR